MVNNIGLPGLVMLLGISTNPFLQFFALAGIAAASTFGG